jgi:HD-GYP domain-containing protein (c-di-GMP phosphodiesterase class II)
MREVPLDSLQPVDSLPGSLLHQSGTILLRAGKPLTEQALGIIRDEGVEKLYLINRDERYEDARQKLLNVPQPLDTLVAGETLGRPLYDQRGALLLEAGSVIPQTLTDSLKRRGIETIYFRRPEEELKTKQGRQLRLSLEQGKVPSVEQKAEKSLETVKEITVKPANPEDLNSRAFRSKVERLQTLDFGPEGEPFERLLEEPEKMKPVAGEVKEYYTNTIDGCLQLVSQIFAVLGDQNRSFVVQPLEEVVNRILAGLIQNRDLLALCGRATNSKNYPVQHALATAVVAVNVGTSMGYGGEQIKSLAYGALLADVGLLRVPTQILEKKEKLTPREKAEIRRHPAYGLDMLQDVRELPSEVPYIIYQSHERSNGSGYPCGKKDVVIHPFAKIVSAADTFTAICSSRPYRSGKTSYTAMERLVFDTSKHLLDRDVTKSFLAVNSLFPIGCFVLLSDKRVARVVGANREDYMRPVVQPLWDKDLNQLNGEERIDLSGQEEISITDVLDENRLPLNGDPLIGF